MPLGGGELVGRAYVRIYGDGSSLPGDIRRAIEDSEPAVTKGGRDAGRTYGEEFDKEARKTFKTKFGKTKKDMFHDLNEGLTKSLADLRLAERYFDGPEWKKFLRRLNDEFGDAGKLAGRRLEAEFRDSADLTQLAARMRNVGKDVRRAQADIVNAMYNDAYRMNREFNARMKRIETERLTTAKRAEQDSLREATLFRNRFKDIVEQVERLERGEPGIRKRRLVEMLGDLRRLAPAISSTDHELVRWIHHIDDQNDRLRRATPLLSTWIRRWDGVSHTMGKIFGLGSRNNFLNFFGVVVRGLVSSLNVFPRFLQYLSRFQAGVQEAFVKAGGGFAGTIAGFQQALIGIGSAALIASGSLVAFAALIGVIGFILGPVVALLSTFVGLLLAMASSAIMAVIGALAGFGPLVFAAGGAVAGVIAIVQALKNAKDAAPELKSALHGVTTEAKHLWDIFRDTALKNLPDALDRVKHALGGLDGLAEAAGKGFNRMLGSLTEALDSPASRAFFDRFERFLPHAEAQLGDIAANAFKGLEGILRASVPLANKLLDWMDGVFEDFSKWANSKRGQREIRQFLQDAADSAEAIGDFLSGAWHWLTQLVDKSKEEGDTLWTRIGGKFERWAKWIEDHPDAFEQWMKDADELATSIGHVVDGLNELIDDLDTEQNRNIANGILDTLAFTLSHFGILLATVNPVASILSLWGQQIVDWAQNTLWPILQDIGSGIWYVVGGAWVGDLFAGIEAGLRAAGSFFAGIGQQIADGLKGLAPAGGGAMVITPHIDLSDIQKGLSKIPGLAKKGAAALVAPFRDQASAIARVTGDIAGRLMDKIRPIISGAQHIADQAVAKFGNFGERMARNIGDLWNQISSKFTSIPGHVATVASDIVSAFSGLGQRIINAIGSINIHINWPDPPGWLSKVTASGGIFAGAQARIIGEAGPEAVVPLNRPLSMVDPAVRWLSAIAQGMAPIPMAAGGVVGGGVNVEALTIVTPSEDPRIVATEVLNQLVARIN